MGDRYERRYEQEMMVDRVRHALGNGQTLLVEAGTGVGKSFAYLLPAIELIVAGARGGDRRRRVVISTHTIALQEQLIHKDLPLLNAVVPEEFSAVLVKGRGNYLSRRRLTRAWERRAVLFDNSDSFKALETVRDWSEGTDDGSLASLPQLEASVASAVWSDIQSDAEDCLGRRCPTYAKCFYQIARRRMENADLLVVNHALFFADLAMRREGFGILPPYDAVILDEAHRIEEVASEHFGRSLGRGQVSFLLSRLHHGRRHRGLLFALQNKIDAEGFARSVGAVDECRSTMERFFDSLVSWHQTAGRPNGRIEKPAVIENTLSPALHDLSLILHRVLEQLNDESDRLEVRRYATRAADLAAVASVLLEQKEPDNVYWLEHDITLRRKRIKLRCAPIDVGVLLRERLFEATIADDEQLPVVMTSATLAIAAPPQELMPPVSAGELSFVSNACEEVIDLPPDDGFSGSKPDPFAYIKARIGCNDAEGLHLGSPFDYTEQAELYVCRHLPEPNDDCFVGELTPVLLQHIDRSDGGAFVLFTSYKLLRQVGDALRAPLEQRGMVLLVQGDGMQRSALLERFRDVGVQANRSVLLGTDSFWQGVDVPGDALRNVIITRLPFVVPDRPLVEARVRRIEGSGGNAFMEYTLPEAILRFKQGFGRLIRSKQDRGSVVVLDRRIMTRPYGHQFLASLPDLPLREMSPPPLAGDLEFGQRNR